MLFGNRKREKPDAEIFGYLGEAGYTRPTLLQTKVIPLILKGGDVAVEAGEKTGKTAAFILPITKIIKIGKPGIKAVVLASDSDKVRKTVKELNKFLRSGSEINFIALHEESEIRREVRQLLKPHDIIVGTPKRFIDHIRRGNIKFDHLQIAVIDVPGTKDKQSFTADAEFVVSKFPHTRQLVVFTPDFKEDGGLFDLLSHPDVITVSDWKSAGKKAVHAFIEAGEREKLSLVSNVILAEKLNRVVIFCGADPDIPKVADNLKQEGFSAVSLQKSVPFTKRNQIVHDFNKGTTDIIITTDSVLDGLACNARHILNYDIPSNTDGYKKRMSINRESIIHLDSVTTFLVREQYKELLQIQENMEMDIKKTEVPDTDDIIKGTIQRIVQKIKEEENPDILNSYKKVIKRNVPFFLRSYFSAYLFKQYFEQGKPENLKTTKLFISVGKNRRVFQKDLVNLFLNNFNIKRSEIGYIRILDNYSFIDVPSNVADEAIKKLNGSEFHGRRITVNFARKREDKRP